MARCRACVVGESDGYNFDLTIRGIGLNSPQDDGSPASVSLHQNGFFIPNPLSLSLGFLDLDHLEVLRGPQGTVFGQNSVGGTLNVITVQPTLDAVKGYADAEFGSLRTSIHVRDRHQSAGLQYACAALCRRFRQAERLRHGDRDPRGLSSQRHQ